MDKDEMKNRISMALEDPTLQQGFEIICKGIAELEKENAELKGIKDVATLIRANNDTVITLMQLNNMLVSRSQQLTKAKEIIKELLNSCFGYNSKTVNYEVKANAEQFLSEVEK